MAYGRLSRLITLGRRNAPKGECRYSFDDVAAHAESLLAGVILPPTHRASADLPRWRELFGDRYYGIAELHRSDQDEWYLGQIRQEANRAGVPMIATGILQRQQDIVHILVDRLEDLTEQLIEVNNRSRDFR